MTNDKKIVLRQETSVINVGNQISITNKILKSNQNTHLPIYGSFTDARDGNVYKTVKIGEQVWMAENLRFMPFVSPFKSNGGIWVYGFEDHHVIHAKGTLNYIKYGCLYDWETAITICPLGWHLPSDKEWNALVNLAGGIEVAGEKLKVTHTWIKIEGIQCSNSSGFSALPGAGRLSIGDAFGYTKTNGFWWSKQEVSSDIPISWALFCFNNSINRSTANKNSGFSVRCVKD